MSAYYDVIIIIFLIYDQFRTISKPDCWLCNPASRLFEFGRKSKKWWWWRHNILTRSHRQFFWHCPVSFVMFSYWSKFTVFTYSELLRESQQGEYNLYIYNIYIYIYIYNIYNKFCMMLVYINNHSWRLGSLSAYHFLILKKTVFGLRAHPFRDVSQHKLHITEGNKK